MSRRGDGIHKRKDGRWEGRYKNGVDENGKSTYKLHTNRFMAKVIANAREN